MITSFVRRLAIRGLHACLMRLYDGGSDEDIVAFVALKKRYMDERAVGMRHSMTIRSTVPSKWRFIDLEESRIWFWDPVREAFLERRNEAEWLTVHGGSLYVTIAEDPKP